MKFFKNKISGFLTAALLLPLIACDNYLDVVPEDDLTTIESIFEKRNTALTFFTGCYRSYLSEGSLGSDPALAGGDELTTGDYLRTKTYSGSSYIAAFKIAEGLQNQSDPILPKWDVNNNYYIAIRDCNTFIQNIDKVYNMDQEEKDKYKASAKAIKALYYFQLMRQYGPICLVDENLSVEADVNDMKIPRSPIDDCVNEIVRLFDEALPYIDVFAEQPVSEYGFLTREAVVAYRSRVLLYAASPLFNGNEWYVNFKNRNGEQLFNQEEDPSKWLRAAEAADEAVDLCESRGKYLNSSYDSESSELLNYMRNIQNAVLPIAFESTEVLHASYSIYQGDMGLRMPRYESSDAYFNNRVSGCVNPSMKMVELFYTNNGLPIDMDREWDYANRYTMGIETSYDYSNVVALNKEVLKLHLHREPRFYANIAFDKGIWKRNNDYVEMEPYRNGRHGMENVIIQPDDKVNITGYWCKKHVSTLNYAAGSNANFTPVAPYCRIRLAEVYLNQAEAWNEYEGPSEKVYEALNKVRERAGIPTIEDSWNNYSKEPSKITTKAGMREIIQQERMIELAFEGQRFWDLRRWKLAHEYLSQDTKGWNIIGTEASSFYNEYKGPVVVWSDNNFKSPRDYFWPFRDEEILKTGMTQNPGW
ncbi:MAG: RagB/SusD family nutrient uptake outer membrane protein [Mangrovibacterium sp.]